MALEDLGLTVSGIAPTGTDAIASVERSQPDVILMDLGLPDQSGLAVGRTILERWPRARIIALTALEDRAAVDEAMRLGFCGYISKDSPVSEFVNGIRRVLDGHLVLPQRMPSKGYRSGWDDAALLSDQLSRREVEVLTLLVKGADSDAIASRLGISRNTVRTHVQSILTKLQVHTRLEAATFAVRHGLVDVPAAGGDAS